MESLNPLVTVETITTASFLEENALRNLIKQVDLVCVTDWDRNGLVSEFLKRRMFPLSMLNVQTCIFVNHIYVA